MSIDIIYKVFEKNGILQKYALSEKMSRIKVVEVIKDYFLAALNLILNLTLKIIWRLTLNF